MTAGPGPAAEPPTAEPAPEAKAPEAKAPDAATPDAATPRSGGRRSWHGAYALIGVLLAILGFAIAVQVHQNSGYGSLSNLPEDDLIGILDNQNNRAERLRDQIAQLQEDLNRLQNSGDRNAAAQQQAKAEAEALGVLLGTLAATGPGITVKVTDPQHKLQAEDVLDIVEELRGAGAEAIQIGPVRVSTSTSFTDQDGEVAADGKTLSRPYTLSAIGGATTLETALNIPGGVAAAVRADGGELTVKEHSRLSITVVRSLPTPRYAKPSH
jgi:uncharacterized protein YlxW (UPF0749 family)